MDFVPLQEIKRLKPDDAQCTLGLHIAPTESSLKQLMVQSDKLVQEPQEERRDG